MFIKILQIVLSLITAYLAFNELKEKFRKRAVVSKKEAKVSLISIIIIAIIGISIQIADFVNTEKDKKNLIDNFNNLKSNNKFLKNKVGDLERNIGTLTSSNIQLIGISKTNFKGTVSEINNSARLLNMEIKRNADIQKEANDFLTGINNIPIFRIYAEQITLKGKNKVILHPSIDNWGASPLYDVGFFIDDTIPPRNFFLGNFSYPRSPIISYTIDYPMEKDSLLIQCAIYWRGGAYYCYATAKKFDQSIKVKNLYYMSGKNAYKQFNPLENPHIKIPRPANYKPEKDKNGKIIKDLPDFTNYQ